MLPEWIGNVLLPLALAFIASVPGILAYRANRLKAEEERRQGDSAIYSSALRGSLDVAEAVRADNDDLREERDGLRRRVATLEDEVAALRIENSALRARVRTLEQARGLPAGEDEDGAPGA